ncbi:larval cuticle protein 65Ag1 [Drosophila grimshawi]|uniref:GH15644 n=1 Tax=Drosophila grimshawi TaxID=7222 RepID=B4J078_DROGR|nr:larval cuticle protein 65Ag1 [Drosophila grimshawi]EDV95679.1 GH15644 [Drosophila grimshawi]
MTVFPIGLLLLSLAMTAAVVDEAERQEEVHFNFQTDNGHRRSEDITYKVKVNADKQKISEPNDLSTPKSVEYRGGYSFISADGYEYQVLYKANKNGFQPYVTAHKVKPAKESS